MLVLRVTDGERIFIILPDGKTQIEIMLSEGRRNQARLCFEADKSIKIFREKVLRKIARETQCGSADSADAPRE